LLLLQGISSGGPTTNARSGYAITVRTPCVYSPVIAGHSTDYTKDIA
jgi:hypothetical protein